MGMKVVGTPIIRMARSVRSFKIAVQNCDGVFAASCPELDITCFGDKDSSAVQEVFEAVRTNAKSILIKRQQEEPLTLPEEKVLAPFAQQIASSRRIQNWFEIVRG